MRRVIVAATVLAVSVGLVHGTSVALAATEASFQGLGGLVSGPYRSGAHDVSADGLVVVGTSGPSAYRWTEAGGMVGLGALPGSVGNSQGHALSQDGSVVVGSSQWQSGNWTHPRAWRWTQAGGTVDLGDLSSDISSAHGVSADGSVIVGYHQGFPFRWTQQTGMVNLGSIQGSLYGSNAFGVSPDGSVVVGNSSISDPGTTTTYREAFRWTEAGGMVGLGELPEGERFSSANAVSSDGSVVVGFSGSALGREAFRWTAGEGMVGLGDLPGGSFHSEARDMSSDGSVVIGYADVGPSGAYEAFIWDAVNGMRNLLNVLVQEHGVDLTGWTLSEARGISDDGLVIVGTGINPDGDVEGWRVAVPEPATLVVVDIKPGSVNLKSKGLLPVVAYGTEGLDVTEIDLDTLLLNGVGPRVKPDGSWHVSFEDVDGDLLLDLAMHFEMQALGIEPGMTELALTGALMDGTELQGADAIRIVPDFNGDLMVNATDLAIMSQSYGTAGVGFELGDANADGLVDATDLALLRLDLGWSESAFGEPIPEPATLLVMAAAGLPLLLKRKRKSRA